ncbi:unnamed protein product [Aphanomyces euteiches]
MLFGGGLMPTYLLVKELHLMNSIWALVLPGMIDAFNVLIMRNFFRSLPESLEESARIDGAGYGKIFRAIVLPLSKPVLATVALWIGVQVHWNGWFDAMIYIKDPNKQVLQIVLRKIIYENNVQTLKQMMATMGKGSKFSGPQLQATMIMFSVIPLLLAYPCTSKKEGGSASEQTNGQKESDSAEKRMDLTFTTHSIDKVKEDAYALKYMQDKFNVNIHMVTSDDGDYREKLMLSIASADIPDYMGNLPTSDFYKLIDQGVLAEIPVDLIKEHMPKYYKYLERSIGPDPLKAFEVDGKNYALPGPWSIGNTVNVVGIRQDWLKNVGITKMPETIDAFEDMLYKFTNNDPDQNGKKDTYGMSSKGKLEISDIFASIFGAYGVYPGSFTVDGKGKVVRGEVEPGAKLALEKLAKWYKDGVIDREFLLNDWEEVEKAVIAGKAGVAQCEWGCFIPGEAFWEGKYDAMKKTNPNVNWVTMPGPKGPNGDYGTFQANPIGDPGMYFGKQLANDRAKMIKYMDIFEAYSFDLETYVNVNRGVKGTTYELTADGDYAWIPPYDTEEKQTEFGLGGTYQFPGSFNDYEFQKPFMTPKKYLKVREAAESVGVGKIDIMAPMLTPVYNEYKDRLKTFTLKSFYDFIGGKRPVSEFDKFVEEWKSMGGQKALDEAQQIYDAKLK